MDYAFASWIKYTKHGYMKYNQLKPDHIKQEAPSWILIDLCSLLKHFLFFIFLAFDFCRFYVVIRFFHPRHNG